MEQIIKIIALILVLFFSCCEKRDDDYYLVKKFQYSYMHLVKQDGDVGSISIEMVIEKWNNADKVKIKKMLIAYNSNYSELCLAKFNINNKKITVNKDGSIDIEH